MRKNGLFLSLQASSLCGLTALLLSGCTAGEDVAAPHQSSDGVWTAVVQATKDSVGGETRAVFFGGNDNRYYTLWDEGDKAEVYKNGTYVGSQTPDTYGYVNSKLTGTLTGSFARDETLFLYVPGRVLTYTGQKGTISDMSSKYAYMTADAKVTEIDEPDKFLAMGSTSFHAEQAYARLQLVDADGFGTADEKRLHVESLTIKAAGGKLVTSRTADGTSTYGDITVTAEKYRGEYPDELFVALRNELTEADTYTFLATVGGDTYVGPADRALTYKFGDGVLTNVYRSMRKTSAASALTVDAVASHVFTGHAYEPVLVVRDGEAPLTLGTDYSVSYRDNVNVGTATATVTGLAQSGSVSATPYLGTKEQAFQITKATPTVTLDATGMTLVNNATQNTGVRTVSQVYIDNSAYGLDNLDITSQAAVVYASSDESVATVNATTGAVTAVGPGSCTITATVTEAANWLTNAVKASYTVSVEQEVTTGNSVSPWDNGGTSDGKIFVE